jgi:hypothetical protein
MENLQTEVLEIEFTEFSHGFKTISDLDFAEILLRYTEFDRDTKKSILKKVKKATSQSNVRRENFSFIENLFLCLKIRGLHSNNLNIFLHFLIILKNSVLQCVFINYQINQFLKVLSF